MSALCQGRTWKTRVLVGQREAGQRLLSMPGFKVLNIAFTMVGILHMKKQLLLLILLVTSQSWANQPSPEEQAKQMAEAACLYQYNVIYSRFTLGFSEEKAIQASSQILTNYLESHKENAGDFFLSSIRRSTIAQLRELEVNIAAVQQLRDPPSDFKDNFLSSCNEMKKEQLEAMHVFG